MTKRRKVAIVIVISGVVGLISLVLAVWGAARLREHNIHHNLRMLQAALVMYLQETNGKAPSSIADLLSVSEVKPEHVLLSTFARQSEANRYHMQNVSEATTRPSDKFCTVFFYEDWERDGEYDVTLDGTVRWNKY